MLHGSPGSGKSTVAEVVVERLRQANVPTALIDLDALSIVHPYPGRWFTRTNLRAVWPNYTSVPNVRVVLPLVVADAADLAELKEIAPAGRHIVGELTAPRPVLEQRVTAREPNDYWKARLLDWVDVYHRRGDLESIRDFQVSTHDKSVDACAEAVIALCGWNSFAG